MADDLEDDADEIQPDQPDARTRIARPAAASGIPPVTLRGLGAPSPGSGSPSPSPIAAPLPGSGSPSPSPIAAPLPIQTRTTADENELGRLRTTGSGVSQIAKAHPIAGGILRGLDTVGSLFAPRITAAIPGTTLHNEGLIRQQQGRINTDLGQEKEEAGIGETGARTEQATATAANQRSEAAARDAAAGQPKPKEEKWDAFTGWTDTDGTPLIREENSGQVVRADNKQPAKGFQAAKPAAPAKTEKITRVVNGVPHEVLVNAETGEDVKDEGQTKVPGESADQKRSSAESAQVERESRQNIRKAEGQYHATQQSVAQLGASIDAAKDGNGLLTSFVPTMEVLGINASNGVHRISPAEAQAAGLPGGWSERFNAWFDKASTGKLSPELQKEGKQLAGILSHSAYQRYKSTYDDENGIVSGYGGTDFGKRVPLIPSEETQGGGAGGNTGGPPAGATMKVPGSDGKLHWSDGKRDLGVAE